MTSLFKQAGEWGGEEWERETHPAAILSPMEQRFQRVSAASVDVSAKQLQAQLAAQEVAHVKQLQAVQYDAQQMVGDIKRQKLAQAQLDVRDKAYEVQTQGIRDDLQHLITEAESAMNSLRGHALSASAEHSAVLGNVRAEVGALTAEAVGLVHSQHARHVESQAVAQQRYHQLEANHRAAVAQLHEFRRLLSEQSVTSAALERQLVKIAWDNTSTLTNKLNTQAVQHSHLQAAHAALQTTAQNLANKVQALGPLPAEKAALAAELVIANTRIQELTAQCAPPICSVCMTTDGNFGFLHSSEMHAGYCLPCSQEIFNTGAGLCPVCRVQIEAVIKVFNQ
ncbi:MAG: hypothetical protein WDW36_008580 [Sanguina aurantia]